MKGEKRKTLLHASTARGTGAIPCSGVKKLHATKIN